VPLASLDAEGELTTPTGAAIVVALAGEFGALPAMTVERIGYGAGQKDFPHPNILRVIVGEAVSSSPGRRDIPLERRVRMEAVVILETNLDNATGEAIGHAVDALWAAGALDVSLTAIQMKKNRPGVQVSAQCRPADVGRMESILFEELPTLGVRRSTVVRTVLARQAHEVETPWGMVGGKIIYLADGSARFSPEFDACRQMAARQKISLQEVMSAAQEAFRSARAAQSGG
jgi:uncharacterized protein (DUF111 family)